MTKDELAEESLIDLAFAVLKERKTAIAFLDLLKEIQKVNGQSDEEIQSRLVQFYTDMNIDGRFLLNHDNAWGLREWYKVETIEEETAPTVKTRKRKSKTAVSDDEEDLIVDEEDLVFEEDFEEFVDEDVEDDVDEDLDFEEEDIDSLDVDAEIDDVEVDDDIIEEDEAFIIDDEELDDEEIEEEEIEEEEER